MGRAGIARLAGRIDADAVVPLPDIHDEAHRGAMRDAEIAQTIARMHRRRAAAALRQGAHVHVGGGRVARDSTGRARRSRDAARPSASLRDRRRDGRRHSSTAAARACRAATRRVPAPASAPKRASGASKASSMPSTSPGRRSLASAASGARSARRRGRKWRIHQSSNKRPPRRFAPRARNPSPEQGERQVGIQVRIRPSRPPVPAKAEKPRRGAAPASTRRRSAARGRGDRVGARSSRALHGCAWRATARPIHADRHPLMRPIGWQVHLVRGRDEPLRRIEAHGQIIEGDEALPLMAAIARHREETVPVAAFRHLAGRQPGDIPLDIAIDHVDRTARPSGSAPAGNPRNLGPASPQGSRDRRPSRARPRPTAPRPRSGAPHPRG